MANVNLMVADGGGGSRKNKSPFEDVDIASWQKFLNNNEDIKRALDRVSSDASDIATNVSTLSTIISTAKDDFASLQEVSLETELKDPNELLSYSNQMVETLSEKALKVILSLDYAEKMIEEYNGNLTISEETKDLFTSFMEKTSDINLYWVVSELLKNSKWKGIGFLLAYGTDVKYEGGNFAVGDGAVAVCNYFNTSADAIYQQTIQNPGINWHNVSIGCIAVAGYKIFIDFANDQGNVVGRDYARYGLDAFNSALTYFEWQAVAGGIAGYLEAAGVSGFYAGLAGTGAAALVAIPTAFLLDKFKNLIVGDYVVDTFTGSDGEKYKIYKNGSGQNGTYDVFLEVARQNSKFHKVNGVMVSEKVYNEMLYNNWQDIYDDNLYGDSTVDGFNKLLENIKNASSKEEAQQYIDMVKSKYTKPQLTGHDTPGLYDQLKAYGFDLDTYYDYTHGGINYE